MRALRTVVALLSRRTPITPHLCLRCEVLVLSISQAGRKAFLETGVHQCAAAGTERTMQALDAARTRIADALRILTGEA